MKRLVFVFAASLVLAGCGAAPSPVPQTLVVTKTIYVPWTMPAYLTQCAVGSPKPVRPHIAADEPHAASKVAKAYLALDAHDDSQTAALADCRETIGAIVQAAAPSAMGRH